MKYEYSPCGDCTWPYDCKKCKIEVLAEQNERMLDILIDIHSSHIAGVNMYDVLNSRMTEIAALITEIEEGK
jgi:hypothetical protein